MLFTYKYVEYEAVEKFQKYLDYIFEHVWCNCDDDWDISKFDGCNDLKEIIEQLWNDEGKAAQFFMSSIQNIYNEFKALNKVNPDYIDFLKEAYKNNNDIERICTDKSVRPISYNEIAQESESLSKTLHGFYSKLYGNGSPLDLKIFGFFYRDLVSKFYEEFVKENKKGFCPFCLLNRIKGRYSSHREALDHFIPKGLYPFNSVNFKNLAPMCHECNSTYKGTNVPIYVEKLKKEGKQDPLYETNNRQLSFYPYSNPDLHPTIEFSLKLKSKDIENLTLDDIELIIQSKGYDEQIASWMRVFGIKERCLEIICDGEMEGGLSWFNDIKEEFENAKVLTEDEDTYGFQIEEAQEYYKRALKSAKKGKVTQKKLEAAFLESCYTQGLFA